MSRVAKAQIKLPANVEFKVENGRLVVAGPKGTLNQHYNKMVDVMISRESEILITFKPANDDPKAWSNAGTVRANVNNMIIGVTKGFSKTLELVGVGFRAQTSSNVLTLSLGFSHPIKYKLPKGVDVETPSNTVVLIKGIDKQLVGQVAAEIRGMRAPEPYKGKGVKYAGEVIVLKEAKKK